MTHTASWSRLLRLAAVLPVLLVAGACDRRTSADAEGLDLLTRRVDTSVTLGAWLAGHPDDAVGARPADYLPADVCRVSTRTISLFGVQMRRSAVFRLPAPPLGETLPADTARFAERSCKLAAVWVEHETPDPAEAKRLADSASRFIAGALKGGSPPPTPATDVPGSRVLTDQWPAKQAWKLGGSYVLTGVSPAVASSPERSAQENHANIFLAAAFGDTAAALPPGEELRIAVGNAGGVDPDALEVITDAAIDSALALVDVEPVRRDLSLVTKQVRASLPNDPRINRLFNVTLDSAIIRAVRATRDSLPSLSPPRRAAALLANDLTLALYTNGIGNDTVSAADTSRMRLASAGVAFENDPLGSAMVYTRPFLWDAYHADSTGVAGRLAFRILLASGWGTRVRCEDGGMAYERVIEQGEAALRAGSNDPLVHYLVGVAYQDIVALAGGALSEYVDGKPLRPRADSARMKAVEHLRAALPGLKDPRLRRLAWHFATRLMLRAPVPTTFICVYD